MLRGLLLLCACCCYFTGLAQSKVNRFTPEVAQQLGIEFSPGRVPDYPAKRYSLAQGKITAFRTAMFDTIATYAQGRVVDKRTRKPIAAVIIQMTFSCASNGGGSETKTVATNQAGFFRIGWVGCSGPEGRGSSQITCIRAAGYPLLKTRCPEFSGAAYLHIELARLYP